MGRDLAWPGARPPVCDLAGEGLAGRGEVGESVHEARKAFKRVRALVRLARDRRVYARKPRRLAKAVSRGASR